MADTRLLVLGICFVIVTLYTSSRVLQAPASSPACPDVTVTCPTCPACTVTCPSVVTCPSSSGPTFQDHVDDEEYAIAHSTEVQRVYLRYGISTNIKLQGWPDVWWTKELPTWENDTFLWFNRLIRPTTTYVGFGEWMGPTLLFAANIAKRSIGLEPDPTAFNLLKGNVDANPSLSSKLKIYQRCISNTWEILSMYGVGASGSFLAKGDEKDDNTMHEKYKEDYPDKKFTVYCLPLWEFLADHEAMTDDMFIKMDCEGAERFIIPSYIDWLSKYPFKHKPAFYISMHSFDKFTEEQKADIFKVVRMYKYYGSPLDPNLKDVALESTAKFVDGNIGEIFLTDRSIDEYPPKNNKP